MPGTHDNYLRVHGLCTLTKPRRREKRLDPLFSRRRPLYSSAIVPPSLHRLLVSPGHWPFVSQMSQEKLAAADLVLWQEGADMGVLASVSPQSRVCELTQHNGAPPELAQSKSLVLIQPSDTALPEWTKAYALTQEKVVAPVCLTGPARVLLTRRHTLNLKLGSALAGHGIHSLPLPTLELGPPGDPERLTQALSELDNYFGVLVTAATGARVLARALPLPPQLKVAAVGEKTASVLAKMGLPCHLHPAEAHSEGLAHSLRARGWLDKSWIHLRGDKGRSVLDQAIQRAGGTYKLVECYQTRIPDHAPALLHAALAPSIQAISFASGQSYRNFKVLLKRVATTQDIQSLLSRLKIVSFGPITTNALKTDGIKVSLQMRAPNTEAQMAAILDCIT